MPGKAGIGSLLLNIALVGAVALVTFMASTERGQPSTEPLWAPSASKPEEKLFTPVDPSPFSTPDAPENGAEVSWDLPRVTAALAAYLAQLDGTLSDQELQAIARDVGVSWKGQTESFLSDLRSRFASGKAEEILSKALSDLGKAGYDQKVKVMAWTADWLKSQGWSWERIQAVTGKWAADILKIDSVDFWGALKKD